jgi:hypothetical protein
MIVGRTRWPWCVTFRPILALAMLLLTGLGDPCPCGVLTRCGMGYRAPQMVSRRGTPRLLPLPGALSRVLVCYAARDASCGSDPHAEEPL